MASQDSQSFPWHYPDLGDKNFEIHGPTLVVIIVIFALLLFFSLLGLYARWTFRDHGSLPITRFPTIATAQPSGAPGLDSATIFSIPIILHRSSPTGVDEAQCSICLSAFIEEEKVKVLPGCHHGYHPECVDKWLNTHSNCPLCRASLLAVSTTITA
ncbi:hypothetical protein GIB67_014305 [Kingdonia uniflora]|uniref:RING-type E3 ubiquitin transferase n=1 Tax=Kingdonia uniflora TaxID=39325 RepID=A0A7J7NT43_9MAGN|nr:hypothetical protein GIB67_014305 [Kingdonia uniflora]